MGQVLAIAVIFLFIGVAFAPSIDASVVKDELVELDVEFCGLGKRHTVKLTQQEADEVELLFDDIEQKLSEVETREEAEIIYKEAVVELDRFGLLGGLSVIQAQRLVTGEYLPPKVQDKLKNYFEQSNGFNDKNDSFLCTIFGDLTNLWGIDIYSREIYSLFKYTIGIRVLIFLSQFCGYPPSHLFLGIIAEFIIMNREIMVYLYEYWIFTRLFSTLELRGIDGTIQSQGINGVRLWKGHLTGDLYRPIWGDDGKPGIFGFTGFSYTIVEDTHFFGFAIRARIKAG
jgi:hypothetical protein